VTADLIVPESFRAMPRWWHEGEAWLDRLPALVARWLADWHLTLDGDPWHGSNALVIPVRREGDPLALRLNPPGAEVAASIRALRFWQGHGVVDLVAKDAARGAMLLQRLDGDRSLAREPLAHAMPLLGAFVTRLAIPAPADVPSTNEILAAERAAMPVTWERLGRPFPADTLDRTLAVIPRLMTSSTLAVNGDLHADQVLPDEAGRWTVVDPVLLRGDPAYDSARILWTRLDEMADEAEIRHWPGVLATAAGIDATHARNWVLFRTISYWLWGLDHGLTEDPLRCARLVSAILTEE
jgi:streptomycin 6-kinase